MRTRKQQTGTTMPPAVYERYEKTRTEFENAVRKPVTRQELSHACWVYGNKLRTLKIDAHPC
jgi:hypothetical protein